MPDKKRLRLCGCIGLAMASFVLIGAIVAQPLFKDRWPSPAAVSQVASTASR
jgi:hypothetical protein